MRFFILLLSLSMMLSCSTFQIIVTPLPPTTLPIQVTTIPPTAAIQPTILPTAVSDRQSLIESGRPCPESRFICINISVPLDHFTPNSRMISVTYAILPASSEQKGFLAYATGGPGSAGVSSADSYINYLPAEIPKHLDLVFFDQRGVGLSGGLYCDEAFAIYYDTDYNTRTPEGESALIEAASQLTTDCLNQLDFSTLKVPGQESTQLLDFMGTQQAAEDLEVFRQLMGDEQFYLYGESYGTQFAQTYAAVHPEHLAGLILDGTVDLTLSGPDYLRKQTIAFNEVLVLTLQACNEDPVCAADMGADAITVYDTLATQLAVAPATFDYPLSSGGTAPRALSLSDFELTVINYLYSETDRTTLLHALADANLANWVPLAEMFYDVVSLDYDSLERIPDPTFSDAIYYIVECNDYGHYSGSPDAQAQAYIKQGDEVERLVPRLSSVFYGDLPCAYWPVRPDRESRPDPLILPGVPTLVLAATADPATPYSNSLSVYSHLADGYLITKQGGPHVIFAWGNSCPDNIVTAFLVEDQLPEQRETTCPGSVIDPYEP